MPIDLRYKPVKCAGCGKDYTCTPDQDYFQPNGTDPEEWTADNGYCWDCFMKVTNTKPQPEPSYGDPSPPSADS
jgi:hypothetical protein